MSSGSIVKQKDALESLSRAQTRFRWALKGLDPYAQRLRTFADAADDFRKACFLCELADDVSWKPQNVSAEQITAAEVQEDNRPGPPEDWEDFDRAVRGLQRAFAGKSFGGLGSAYSELASAARELADHLDVALAADADESDGRARKAG